MAISLNYNILCCYICWFNQDDIIVQQAHCIILKKRHSCSVRINRNPLGNGKRKIDSLVLLLFYEILSKRLLWQKKKTCLHLYHIYLNGINVCIALYITWQMMFHLLQGKYENISDALKYYKLSFTICSAMYINQYLHWTYKNPKVSIWR